MILAPAVCEFDRCAVLLLRAGSKVRLGEPAARRGAASSSVAGTAVVP
jgi:hypothetical protein